MSKIWGENEGVQLGSSTGVRPRIKHPKVERALAALPVLFLQGPYTLAVCFGWASRLTHVVPTLPQRPFPGTQSAPSPCQGPLWPLDPPWTVSLYPQRTLPAWPPSARLCISAAPFPARCPAPAPSSTLEPISFPSSKE
jgi:hypothetical protein